jgi:hypothetical protein
LTWEEIWKGPEVIQTSTDNSYRNSLWEIDARNFEKEYSQIIYDHPDFKKYLKYLDLTSGKKNEIEDVEATIKSLNTDGSQIQIFRNQDKEIFWLTLNQINPKAKKWTKSLFKKVWADTELLYTQKYIPIMRELTSLDFV